MSRVKVIFDRTKINVLEHIYSPLIPIWLIRHINRAFEWKMCSDLEPGFKIKYEGYSRIFFFLKKNLVRNLPSLFRPTLARILPTVCLWYKRVFCDLEWSLRPSVKVISDLSKLLLYEHIHSPFSPFGSYFT